MPEPVAATGYWLLIGKASWRCYVGLGLDFFHISWNYGLTGLWRHSYDIDMVGTPEPTNPFSFQVWDGFLIGC
jgi:hypothetical protein